MDFDILVKKGNFGFYKRCEVTEVFCVNKEVNSPLNLYTLIYFQDEDYNGKNFTHITEKLIKINDDYSLGIVRYYLSISDAKKRYENLKNNLWISAENKRYKQDDLDLIPKQFINLEFLDSRFKQILKKEDGIQSSYVLEFFSYDSRVAFNGNFKEFNKICELLNKYLNFNFEFIPERLGNFIFQLPNTVMKVKDTLTDNNEGVNLSVEWSKQLNKIPKCSINVLSKYDDIILGNSKNIYDNLLLDELYVHNLSKDGLESVIYNLDNNLILYYYSGGYLSNISLILNVVAPNDYRTFFVGDKKEKIQLQTVNRPVIINRKTNKYNDIIQQSIIRNKKINLANELSFKQYPNDGEDSIKDLQKLISENDRNGVYLWDPYLKAEDIFKTLFYSPTKNVPLRAITSKEAGKINVVRKGFIKNKDNIGGLNLKIKMQHGKYGYKFHDRFLMFPIKEEPKVYSLGTSINSFGKSHHILHLVSHPDLIISAFNDLWNQLDEEECLVWDSSNPNIFY